MEDLHEFDTLALQRRWFEEMGCKPPSRASREYLLMSLMWNAQAKQHGGLSRSANRQIKALMQQLRDGKPIITESKLTIKTGTKLLREYRGIKHEVIVAESGYRYQDKVHGSLSSIAREITGTRWNGKVFFGVKT